MCWVIQNDSFGFQIESVSIDNVPLMMRFVLFQIVELTWSPPKSFSEFDRYQFSLSLRKFQLVLVRSTCFSILKVQISEGASSESKKSSESEVQIAAKCSSLLTFRFSPRTDSPPKVINKEGERIVSFGDLLNAGKTYEVVAKTVSGNVVSWPLTKNITTRPLPVVNLVSYLTKQNEIQLKWLPANDSIQDSYLIKYHELEGE